MVSAQMAMTWQEPQVPDALSVARRSLTCIKVTAFGRNGAMLVRAGEVKRAGILDECGNEVGMQ
jgi:hypothetical protein